MVVLVGRLVADPIVERGGYVLKLAIGTRSRSTPHDVLVTGPAADVCARLARGDIVGVEGRYVAEHRLEAVRVRGLG